MTLIISFSSLFSTRISKSPIQEGTILFFKRSLSSNCKASAEATPTVCPSLSTPIEIAPPSLLRKATTSFSNSGVTFCLYSMCLVSNIINKLATNRVRINHLSLVINQTVCSLIREDDGGLEGLSLLKIHQGIGDDNDDIAFLHLASCRAVEGNSA